MTVRWTGNLGEGTNGYRSYGRNHVVTAGMKPPVLCSSDASFRGDVSRYNPEELFLASIASCHMLWYLHLCSDAGVIVVDYADEATGMMEEAGDGSGRFTEVTLHPVVTVSRGDMTQTANALHQQAHGYCFIANSCNFPIRHKPVCRATGG